MDPIVQLKLIYFEYATLGLKSTQIWLRLFDLQQLQNEIADAEG